MLDRGDEPSAESQHASQLGRCRSPVLQVMQHQRRNDVVERAVRKQQRICQISDSQVRVVAEASSGLLEHPRARVDAGHDSAPIAHSHLPPAPDGVRGPGGWSPGTWTARFLALHKAR